MSPARVRVSQGVLQQQVTSQITPAYPAKLRKAGAAGRISIAVVVGKLGRLENARITDGDPRLAEVSLQALKQWRWKPYILNGEATGMESTVVFEYRADSGKVLINPVAPATVDVRQALTPGQHQ